MGIKLSAVLIVKNEKDHIRTVLESLKGVDEIIVCDTGSTDNTIEIAKEYTDKVFTDYSWNDDFAEARNHAKSKATGDWIISIDGDEQLITSVEKIRKILHQGLETVYGNVNTFGVTLTSMGHDHTRVSIFRNKPDVYWVGRAHETIFPVEQNILPVTIQYGYSTAHQLDPYRMVRILQNDVDTGNATPRNLYYLAREYYYKKDWSRSLSYFKMCVERSHWNPEKSDALLYIARSYFYNGEGDKAREACLKAISINPDFKEALLFMAELHFEPWKHKWLQFAELATNENVIFVRI